MENINSNHIGEGKHRKKNRKNKHEEHVVEQHHDAEEVTNTNEQSADSQRSLEKDEEQKVNDSPGNSSVDGSTRRLFLQNLKENAKVLQSQIGELQNDASDYVGKWVLTMLKFEDMKNNINSKLNNFFRGVFNLLGYNYHIDSEKINFFIFASQSWLMEITKITEKKMDEFIMRDKKFTYRNLLTIMKESDITDENFLSNLIILTSSSSNEHSFASSVIENNVGKLFLNGLTSQLQSYNEIDEDIDNKKFEMILSDVLRRAVESTLNTMENQFDTDSMRNVAYTDLYDDKLSFEEYFEKVKLTQKSLNSISLYSLKICTESFYYFAKCRLDEMIKDIIFFTKNYSSIFFKTRMYLGQNVLNNERVCLFLNKVSTFVDKTSNSLNNLRKEKLTEFYELASKVKKELYNSEQSLVLLKQKAQDSIITKSTELYNTYPKKYITPLTSYSITIFNSIKDKSQTILGKPMTIILDLKNFIANQWNLSKDDYLKLKENLTNYINTKYNEITVHIKPVLFVEKDGETYFRFSLNKNFLFIDPLIVLDVYHYINNYVKAAKEVLIQNAIATKELGYEKLEEAKEYCIYRYKKFLGLCEEKVKKQI
jgi:hypothetical protein